MNLNPTTLARLLALANKIIEQYGGELVAILRDATIIAPSNPPPVVPVPLPAPATSLPEGFDEWFYLSFYPDVAEAVKKGVYRSGGEHYIQWGFKEGRMYRRLLTSDLPGTPVTPPPLAANPLWEPKAAYPNAMALLHDLQANKFSQAVTVDGRSIYEGFGPAYQFHSWGDGTVRTEDSGQLNLPLDPKPVDGEVLNLNP